MLPDHDGIEVCRRLRTGGIWSPVLMLTARDSVEDRVEGLDSGADDYLVKPFAFAELLARLRALTRRGDAERPAVLAVGDLRLDPATREVHRGDTPVLLSAKEFAVLTGSGLFLYLRLDSHLSLALDRELQLRAQDVAALVRQPSGTLETDSTSRLVERGESYAQLVAVDGRVLDATQPLGRAPVL